MKITCSIFCDFVTIFIFALLLHTRILLDDGVERQRLSVCRAALLSVRPTVRSGSPQCCFPLRPASPRRRRPILPTLPPVRRRRPSPHLQPRRPMVQLGQSARISRRAGRQRRGAEGALHLCFGDREADSLWGEPAVLHRPKGRPRGRTEGGRG